MTSLLTSSLASSLKSGGDGADSKEAPSSGLALDLLVPGLLGPVGRIVEGGIGGQKGDADEARSAIEAFCATLDTNALDRLLDRCRYAKDEEKGESQQPSFEGSIFRLFGWADPPADHDWPVAALTATIDRPQPSQSPEAQATSAGDAAASPLSEAPPEAPLEAPPDVDRAQVAWLRADPVHLLADIADLVLSDPLSLAALDASSTDSPSAHAPHALYQVEADAFAQAINDALEPQGPFVVAAHPSRWYVALPSPPRLKTVPPSTLVAKAVSRHLPEGEDAAFWRRWSNLVQMALHECPANIERSRRGAMPINSLWLWGGGRLPGATEDAPRAFECVWSDDPLVRALARRPQARGIDSGDSEASHRPQPWGDAKGAKPDGRAAFFPALFPALRGAAEWMARTPSERSLSDSPSARHLVVHDALRRCAKRSDPQGWREGIEDFSASWAEPLLEALRAGRLARLSILDEYGHRFTASAASAKRRWWPLRKRGLAGAMSAAMSAALDR